MVKYLLGMKEPLGSIANMREGGEQKEKKQTEYSMRASETIFESRL